MRALRIVALLFAILSLLGGASAIVATATVEVDHSIRQVSGTVDVHRLPGGTFDVEDRVFQYRDYPVAGSGHYMSDSRLAGYVLADWNWDVQSSGDRPIPAWGTIVIDAEDGQWTGSFTGIRPSGFKPVDVRAVLFGDGAYEGLCATLDITAIGLASTDTWIIDGVVHPMVMEG
jgi:hypothetical protein